MKYIDEDLDYIFIRAKNRQGKWDSVSVRTLDKKQWEDWLKKRWGNGKKFWKDKTPQVAKEEWTSEDKLSIINWLAKRGAVIVMISRKARPEYKK